MTLLVWVLCTTCLQEPVKVTTVQGYVMDQNNKRLSWANVSLYQDKKLVASVQADEHGFFTFEGKRLRGRYQLRCQVVGFLTAMFKIRVSPACIWRDNAVRIWHTVDPNDCNVIASYKQRKR
ncbi:MAG: carboxypeptidase regulatory-like domain-containing protein [Acidobacteria bacterium]|nr:carboxypeptidase regulatory-like domain-containing protein [Acidobacteriota bacterium]